MTYIAFVGLITALIALFMGLLVFLVEKKSTINTLVQVSFLSVFALGVTVFFAGDKNQDIHSVLALWKLGYIGILFTPTIIVHTVQLILGIVGPLTKKLLTVLYSVSIFFTIALFSGFVLKDLSFSTWGYYDPNADTLGYFYILFLFLSLTYAIVLCIKNYREISPTQKSQIFGLFLALMFGGLGAFFFYLPDFGITEYRWGTLFLAGYPALMGYAILRYQFFDISDAFLRVFRLLGSIFLGGIIFAAVLTIIFGWEIFWEIITLKNISLYVFGGILWFLIYKSKFAHDFSNSKEKQVLSRIIERFLSDTRPHDSIEDLESTMKGYFHEFLEDTKLALYDRIRLSKYPGLVGHFRLHTSPLKKEDVAYKEYAAEFDGEILFPLYSEHGHVIGIFIIGKKKDGELYSQEDIDLLSQILLKLSLSLQVLSHNLDLRVEVLRRTYELTEKNKELEKAYEELKEIDKNKDNFLAIASHELRTPMTIIKGYADMLIAGTFGSLSEEQKKYMLQIYNSTEELINFVNNILDISKLEAGRMTFTYKPFGHRILTKKVVDNFMTLCAQKSISLTLTDSCIRDTIESDEAKLVLILNNLLSNAYKFTNANGKIEVKISDIVQNEKEFLQIEVSDTGIGMTEETQKHIFEKYNQAQNQEYTKKSIEGSGLGLHLTQEVITHMGGNIQARSQINIGTTITAMIPYSQTL